MTRLLLSLLTLIAPLAMLAACQSATKIPDMPKAPEIVRVPVIEYVVPSWLVQSLPEDAPHANTPSEAIRLACVRLVTIQLANCRAALGRQLANGQAVDPLTCSRADARQCEVRP